MYRAELGDLRSTLTGEVETLRSEFQDLRASLRQQVEATKSPIKSRGEDQRDQPTEY